MTSGFMEAMEFVLKWEGGYVNDPIDPGGETNFGISKRKYPILDIKNLKKEQAINIYFHDYWVPAKCEMMNSPLSMVHMDCAVNSGIHQAAIILQRAIGVDDDGLIGPITIETIRNKDADTVAILAIAEREHFYRVLVEQKPELNKFLNGWLNRCESLKEAIHG